MTERDFADLVRRMREHQKLYFRSRDPATLRSAQRLEREVDDELRARRTPDLFAAPQDEGGVTRLERVR